MKWCVWSRPCNSPRNGEVCPAGWKKGQKGMKPTADGVAAYLAENASAL